MTLLSTSNRLTRAVAKLTFAPPVTHVYNPLDYAAKPHRAYLSRYGGATKEILLVGMNPGPFGMAQTGVPFGEVAHVRDWLKLEAPVGQPSELHPKRPIEGFACTRSEVSGARLWGWAKERFGTPERFFARFFVWNYCPLVFMEATGRNRTPDKLPAPERQALFTPCDAALREIVSALQVRYVIGIGKFAEDRARAALDVPALTIGRIPHPSPANPIANRGWAPAAEQAFAKIGIDL